MIEAPPSPLHLDPPGSDSAAAAGCRCPILDNHFGRGRYGDGYRYGWLYSVDCPLHGVAQDAATT